MIAGHFGFAALVKAKAPKLPLWALMLGSQWLDVMFVPLLAAGRETIAPLPGAAAGDYGQLVIHADYTHSLVGALILSALFGLAFLRSQGFRGALILGGVSMSHWILDLLMHHQDMPLLPGHGGELGFGLWRSMLGSAALELALVVLGGLLYARAARTVAGSDPALLRRATWCGGLAIGFGVLTLAMNLAGL